MVKTLISWQTQEFISKDRSPDWFWAVGIISLAIIITSVLLNNLLLAIFFLITTVTIFIYARKEPETILVEITEDGIRAGQNMHPYSLLQAFKIKDGENTPLLFLKSSSVINPIVVIPIMKTDPEKIHNILKNYLLEEEIEEPLSQKLLEYLGF